MKYWVNNNMTTMLNYYRSQIPHSLSKAPYDRVKYTFTGKEPGG